MAATPAPARRGRPLPAFHGTTIDGRAFDLASLIGRRALLFFYNPDAKGAGEAARAVTAIAGSAERENFRVVGIAAGVGLDSARRFAAEQSLPGDQIFDGDGLLSQGIGLHSPLALVLVDAEGDMVMGTDQLPSADGASAGIEVLLREWLRLPKPDEAANPLGPRPEAPAFQADRGDEGPPLSLASLRGKPVVLIFFLHTCPHCHEALEFLKGALAAIPEASRPELVGVSVVNRPYVVRETLRADGLDFFTVVYDPDDSIQRAYGAVAGVPVIFLIDAEGRIQARVDGWRSDREPPLMRMRLAKLAGQPVPMLLHSTGYSGTEFCAVCHESEAATWQLTDHAAAFDTLVRHGSDHDPECVGCHVVGYDKPGGYALARPVPELENVGCEDCHGRGGPHLSPDFVTAGDYAPVCVTCHNTTHSLKFDYATFRPRISHKALLQIASLPEAEQQKLRAKQRSARNDVLRGQAKYVGSAACQSCHAAEYATWAQQPHGRAIASLEAKHMAGNADCLRCHTTGYGADGGFPPGAPVADHPALAAVGCESCHGPGGDHVAEGANHRDTILSLGDKCDSCVVLQICGSCHDDANDPGFEFEVQAKIDRQRHGTIHVAPETSTHAAPLPHTAQVGLLERAFAPGGAGQ